MRRSVNFTRQRGGFVHVVALSGLLASAGPGCENSEPVSRIGSCEVVLLDAVKARDGLIDQSCELTKAVWIVALPGESVSTASLQSTGIPEDAALMLSQREFIRPEWCTVEELAPQPRPNGVPGEPFRRFEKGCISTKLTIPSATAVRAEKVVISAKRSGQAGVTLVRLAAMP